MVKDEEIFDAKYIGDEQTKTDQPAVSKMKEYIKKPIKEIEKYGTSKPRRVIIKAKITNG